MATNQKPGRNRPTLGVLIDWLEEKYQTAVCAGIEDAARRLDVNLIYFPGGALRPPHWFEAQRNVIYDLAGVENVDGLILFAAAISHYVTPAEVQNFCERYRPLPMVSLALALERIPALLVDNEQGMRALLTHLLKDHGYRRLAFINGPEHNPDAAQRYRVYQNMLAQYAQPLDPALIVPGTFLRSAGIEAVRVLLDERHIQPQAIIAANDEMAIGVLEALAARGIGVPEEIAVLGFDDVHQAQFTAPPLTTVRQPLYEQGRAAVEMLLAQLAGQNLPQRTVLPAELQIRRSCGCQTAAQVPPPAGEPDESQFTGAASQQFMSTFEIPKLLDAICAELLRLRIPRFYLALYEGQAAPAAWSRLILAYTDHKPLEMGDNGRRFPSLQLIPPDLLDGRRRFSFLVEPLYFGDEQFGFAVYEKGPAAGYIYETLSVQISNALKGVLMVEEAQNRSASLEAAVAERTAALLEANEQLQREAAERSRTEERLTHQVRELAQTHRWLAEARESVQLRLAQSLHTDVVQQLAGLSAQLEALRRQLTAAQNADRQLLAEFALTVENIRRQLFGVSEQVRKVVSDLQTVSLSEAGLLQGIRDYVTRLQQEGKAEMVEIKLDLPETLPPMPEMAAACLLRAAQEALRNALQHSGGHHITLKLHCTPITAILSVHDDGIGFRAPTHFNELTRNNCFGLAALNEHVDLVGGQLSIRSEPDNGTEITVSVPLHHS